MLTDPAEKGAVTLALLQDVQAEACDFPEELFAECAWHVSRALPDAGAATGRARARRPLIVAGGGVIYSEATAALRRLVDTTGIPVVETMAGKGALPYDHPCALGRQGSRARRARCRRRAKPTSCSASAPLVGLQDGVPDGVRGPRGAIRERQRRRTGRPQAGR